MTITFDDTFTVIEKNFSFIGLSGIHLRKSSDSIRLRLQLALFIFGFCHLFILNIGEIIFTVKVLIGDSNGKYLKAAECLPCVIFCSFGLLKAFIIVVKKGSVVKLVEDLKMMWPKKQNEENNKIILQSVGPTKQFVFVYSIVANGLPTLYHIFPMVLMLSNYITLGATETLLPYYIWYPMDWSTFSLTYFILYISQCFAGIYATCAISSGDALYCIIIAQVCMQFKLLCRDLHNASRADGASNLSVKNKLNRAVKYHTKLILICKAVEEVFGLVLMFNLLLSSLMLCVLLFSIMIAPLGLLVKYVMFLSTSLTQILMMSYYGNRLIEESEEVSSAVFYSEWTDLEAESDRKVFLSGILMIQNYCQVPITITALGFYSISLVTFTSILSAAWSYFTLLRTVYQNSVGNQ